MKRIIMVVQLFFSVQAFGQVTFQFIPEVYGRSVDALLNIKIINASGRKSGSLELTVTERKTGTILVLQTANFNLYPGINTLPVAAARNAHIAFSNNPIGVITKHDNNFPPGDYEYCFTFNGSGNPSTEQCFDYQLVPFAELHLIEPYDKDTLCDKKPTLNWQPLVPTLNGTNYQVVVAEIKQGQNPVEALNYNLPVINQSFIMQPILIYPAIYNELEEGKNYAWQVTAYKDRTILSRSETWQFTVQCGEKKKPVINDDDGYRDVEDLLRGNYYIAVEVIKFSLTNPYRKGNFKYQIESLNDPGKKIKGLPKIKLENGKNKIRIDLANTDSFTDGNSYILKLWLPDGTIKNLRFIYRD